MTTARVKVYSRTGTFRGTLSGLGLSWSHGKGVDSSHLAMTASGAEAAMVSDPAMLTDAVGVVEVDYGSGYAAVGTPYLLAPGSGVVLGDPEGAARQQTVAGEGVLMLTAGWPVLHQGGTVNRRGPEARYFGWMSPTFDDSAWDSAHHYNRTPAPTTAKASQPAGWPDPAADWLDNVGGSTTGGLTLFRSGTFTVSTARKYRFVSTADEEHKVYLMGPGWGGVIIEASAQETGYTQINTFDEVLQPGTYSVAVEMTTIDSAGGDGIDVMALSVMTVGADGKPQLPAVLNTSSTWTSYSQNVASDRPGLPTGELVKILRTEASTWGLDVSLLTPTFTNTVDSGGATWTSATERSWSVGTPISQVLADLSLVADFDARTGNHFDAYLSQGSDLHASVLLRKGTTARASNENVAGYSWDADSVTGTRAIFKTQGGFGQRIDTGAESTYAPRSIFVESSQAVSVGAGSVVAAAALNVSSDVVHRYTAQIIPVSGCLPEVDFSIGDVIAGYNSTGGRHNGLTVTSISGQWDDKVTFTLELSE